MLSIPYQDRYQFELSANCSIQLAFEVEEKKYVQQIISNLSKKVIGLHMRLNDKGDHIFYQETPPPIIKIPNFKNIEIATLNYGINYKLNPFTRFGSIGYNDNMVILNISHSVGDGGYFKYITENIFDNSNVKIPSHFPYEINDILKEKFDKSPNNIPFWDDNKDVNRITTNDPTKLFKTKEVAYSTVRIPSHQLQCYSQKDKKLHAFTDYLWSSLFVSSIVHSHSSIPSTVCIPTCTDLRRYLSKQNYSICSFYSTVSPCVAVRPNDSLRFIGESLKRDLNRRMKIGEDLGFLKTIESLSDQSRDVKIVDSPKKVGIELTYVGAVNIKRPITNIFMNLNMDANYTDSILSLMGFACKSEDKNDVTLRLRYSPSTLYKEEVVKMMKSIEFILTKIPPETSLIDTVKAVTMFHKK